jgi:hypothetical protein
MAFRVRTSVKVGPFKFNLSNAGIGVSAGIKGFRVGTGPRGNYIRIGAGGLSYRQTFSGGSPTPQPQPNATFDNRGNQPAEAPSNTHGAFEAIDSGEITQMVDLSSEDLVNELNAKKQKWQIWPVIAVLGAVLTYCLNDAGLAQWLVFLAAFTTVLLTMVAAFYDTLSKSVVMMYDIEDGCHSTFENLHSAFDMMKSCRASWHLSAQAGVTDSKYHAGAGTVVKRKAIALSVKNPPFIKTNVATPCIPVGSQTLYFFPDRVLVFELGGVGAVSYENLRIDISATRFIEDGGVPRDAKVVGQTWKYVNKGGGPDKRFNNNCEIPIALYQDIHFSSATGLNECIQLSRTDVTQSFCGAIRKVGSMLRA